jgi:hypothetical protein
MRKGRGGARAGLTALVAAVALGSCFQRVDLSTLEASPEAVNAREVVELLARGKADVLALRLDPSLRDADTPEKLRQMSTFYRSSIPSRVLFVGLASNRVKVVGGTTTETWTISFEHEFPDTNVMSEVTFRRVNSGERTLVGLRATPLSAPLEVLNRFTFAAKGPLHYVILLSMGAVAAVTLAALAVWIRRRKVIRRRWWWLLAIVFGAFKVVFNWTSGAIDIQPLAFQVLSLGFQRAGQYGPWFLMISLPAGAVAFLIHMRDQRADERRAMQERAEEEARRSEPPG